MLLRGLLEYNSNAQNPEIPTDLRLAGDPGVLAFLDKNPRRARAILCTSPSSFHETLFMPSALEKKQSAAAAPPPLPKRSEETKKGFKYMYNTRQRTAVCFFSFGWAHGSWKFRGQGSTEVRITEYFLCTQYILVDATYCTMCTEVQCRD